jgi:O-antigen ligase
MTAVSSSFGGVGSARDSGGGIASKLPVLAGIALLGVLCGFVVAIAGLNALYLCAALVACAFILFDFRIGVVLLILLMPISNSKMFPHAILGITGLNPLNLLLIATLGSYLFRGTFNGSHRRFIPRPLLWLYIVPIVIAGALGVPHFGDIPPVLFNRLLDFNSVTGYIRELLVKPLLIVIFALLVGAAASRSEKPERFLIPTLISMWVMCSMVIAFVYQSGVSLAELASSTSREFLSALGMHANELGRLYEVSYALLLFTWAESKESKLKFALFASMVPVVVALMLTFSRGAFLGFIVVNVLFLLWRRNLKTLIFGALLAAAVLLLLPSAVYDRVTTGFGHGFGSGTNMISAGRIEYLWLPLLPDVPRSPIYGHGLGSMLWSDAMRTGAGVTILAAGHPHNAYLQALLDMGAAGLILVCAYFVHVWKGLRALSVDPDLSPTLRGFYLGAAAGLVALSISYLTDSSLLPRAEQTFLWLAIGMMYAQRASARVKEPGPGR